MRVANCIENTETRLWKLTVQNKSVNSNSKSRSSAQGSKEFGRLITKSKLRLSTNINKTESSVKVSSKTYEYKIRKLEDTNLVLMKENK